MKKIVAITLVAFLTLVSIPAAGQASGKAKAKVPAKVSEVKLTDPSVPGKKHSSVVIGWEKAKNAKKYEVHQLTLKKAWRKYKVVKKTAKNKKKYTVKGKYRVKKYGRYRYRVFKYTKAWYPKAILKKTTLEMNKLLSGYKYSFKIRGVKGSKRGEFSDVVSIKIAKDGGVTIKDSTGTTTYYETKEGHDFINKAKQHVGGDYKIAGKHLKDPSNPKDKNSIDCTGLVQALYKKYVGIKLPSGAHSKMIKYALKLGATEVESMDAVAVGDLLFYKLDNHSGQHVAIYAGNGKVLDASPSRKGWADPYNTRTKKVKLDGVFIRDPNQEEPYSIIRILNTEAEKAK